MRKWILVLVVATAGCVQTRGAYEDPRNIGEMVATIQKSLPGASVHIASAKNGERAEVPESDELFYQLFGWKVSADDGFAHHWFTIFEFKIGSPTVRYEIIVVNGTNMSNADYEHTGDQPALSPVIGKRSK